MNSQKLNGYKENGVTTFSVASVLEHIPFLQKQIAALYQNKNKVRPWHLWNLHNPWGASALNVDSWKFLDLCQSAEFLEQISQLIGDDIILYDSQFSPDLSKMNQLPLSWTTDSLRCPVEPLSGLVVRVPFTDSINEDLKVVYHTEGDINKTDQIHEQSLEIKTGQILCHDINLYYRIEGIEQLKQPMEYVIRYYPATSHYVRDQTTKLHRNLTELFPLLNYAQMPLWLVRGEDKADNDFVTGFQPKAGRWIT